MLNWKNWQNMAVFDTKYEVSSYNIVIGATNNTHISLPILSDLSQPDIHPPWNISSLPSPTNYLSTYFSTWKVGKISPKTTVIAQFLALTINRSKSTDSYIFSIQPLSHPHILSNNLFVMIASQIWGRQTGTTDIQKKTFPGHWSPFKTWLTVYSGKDNFHWNSSHADDGPSTIIHQKRCSCVASQN